MSGQPTIRANEPAREPTQSGLEQGAFPQGNSQPEARDQAQTDCQIQNKNQLNQLQLDNHQIAPQKEKTRQIITDLPAAIRAVRALTQTRITQTKSKQHSKQFQSRLHENNLQPGNFVAQRSLQDQLRPICSEQGHPIKAGFDKPKVPTDHHAYTNFKVQSNGIDNHRVLTNGGLTLQPKIETIINQENIYEEAQKYLQNGTTYNHTASGSYLRPKENQPYVGGLEGTELPIVENDFKKKISNGESVKRSSYLNYQKETNQNHDLKNQNGHFSIVKNHFQQDVTQFGQKNENFNTLKPQEIQQVHQKVQMSYRTKFQTIDYMSEALNLHEDESNQVLIQFQIPVAGHLVSDQFLWPLYCRDVPTIKQFACSLLADLFGSAFVKLDPREIEYFCIHLVYLIQRDGELELIPDTNFRSLVMDGFLGPGLGRSAGHAGEDDCVEHVFKIQIDVVLKEGTEVLQVRDEFEWDLSNPDNSPDDMATLLVADLLSNHLLDSSKIEKLHRSFASQLAIEIRRKIQLHVTSAAKMFVETSKLVQQLDEEKVYGQELVNASEVHCLGGGTLFESQLRPPNNTQRKRDQKSKVKFQEEMHTDSSTQSISKWQKIEQQESDISLWAGMALKNKQFKPLPIILQAMTVRTQTHLITLPPEIQEEEESCHLDEREIVEHESQHFHSQQESEQTNQQQIDNSPPQKVAHTRGTHQFGFQERPQESESASQQSVVQNEDMKSDTEKVETNAQPQNDECEQKMNGNTSMNINFAKEDSNAEQNIESLKKSDEQMPKQNGL